MTQKLVVIGAGMASGRALEHVLEGGGDFDITLFGAEPRGNYNRIMLSPVLSGEKTYEEIVTHDAAWYAENGITTRFGEYVSEIDPEAKVIKTASGDVAYDKLLLATGSDPFIIPVPGKDLEGVMAYRDLDDVERMKDYASKPHAKAVVIGGGLLGLEAAAGLKAQGMDVTVIHLSGHLMERQLDPAAGFLLKRELELRGIKVLLEAHTAEIRGEGKVEAVLLKDGRVIAADMVCMAVGIRPAAALGKASGIACNRGIIVDDQM
ncbi:MAG: FAD-dependent oxidoreductase, partial [Pseudomonadota bacterium]